MGTRIVKVILGPALALLLVAVAASPASAGIHAYLVSAGSVDYYDSFSSYVATMALTPTCSESSTLFSSGSTSSGTVDLAQVTYTHATIAGGSYIVETTIALSGAYSGRAPAAVSASGYMVQEFRSAWASCAATGPIVCTITAANLSATGSINDGGFGVSNLQVGATGSFFADNSVFETNVVGSGCGLLAVLQDGEVDITTSMTF